MKLFGGTTVFFSAGQLIFRGALLPQNSLSEEVTVPKGPVMASLDDLAAASRRRFE